MMTVEHMRNQLALCKTDEMRRIWTRMISIQEFRDSVQHIDLRRCPFCDSGAQIKKLRKLTETDTLLYNVECLDGGECLSSGPMRETPELAAEAWNKRPETASIVDV